MTSDSDEHRNGENAERLSGEAMPARAGTASPETGIPTDTVSVEQCELWCLHVLGMDDVYPAPDRATAQLWAAQWTVWYQRRSPEPHRYDPVTNWIVALWPHDAGSHAAGLAKSIERNTFPVDPLAAASTAPLLAEIEAKDARIAELEAGLEPFAREANTWWDHTPDDDRPWIAEPGNVGGDDAEFTLGDLRIARALLSPPHAQEAGK